MAAKIAVVPEALNVVGRQQHRLNVPAVSTKEYYRIKFGSSVPGSYFRTNTRTIFSRYDKGNPAFRTCALGHSTDARSSKRPGRISGSPQR